MSSLDWDFYKVSVPHAQVLTVDQVFSADSVGLLLSDDSTCNPASEASYSDPSGVNTISYQNNTGATQDIYLSSWTWNGNCDVYDLSISVSPGPCSSGFDDSFEPNDSCGSAMAITTGLHEDLVVDLGDEDYYKIQIPAGQVLTIEQAYSQGTPLPELGLFDDSTCAIPAAATYNTGSSNVAQWVNDTGTTQTIHARCSTLGTSSSSCAGYDLHISMVQDPCQAGATDDTHEDNDTCATATPIDRGVTTELYVEATDQDYYEMILNPGERVSAVVYPDHPSAELDLYLFTHPNNCTDTAGAGVVFQSVRKLGAQGQLLLDNTTGLAPLPFYLLVRVSNDSQGACSNYDIEIVDFPTDYDDRYHAFCFGDGSANSGGLPAACPCNNNSGSGSGEGCVNSQGHGAILSAANSNEVAPTNSSNRLRLSVSQARPNSPSMIVQGANAIATPFKDGILCAGNPTERLEVIFLDNAGNGISQSMIAQEGNVLPGERAYYQVWYRDPSISVCGTGSNFTNGIVVNWI